MTTTGIPALLEPIQNRLSRAEDSAVTCQGDGLDKDYINALEVVSVDTARLLAAVQAVVALANQWKERGEHLIKYSETVPEEVGEALADEGHDFTQKAAFISSAVVAALGGEA